MGVDSIANTRKCDPFTAAFGLNSAWGKRDQELELGMKGQPRSAKRLRARST